MQSAFCNYVLYLKFYIFVLQYVILIKKCKRDLAILMHCQLYIKAPLSYTLKIAS